MLDDDMEMMDVSIKQNFHELGYTFSGWQRIKDFVESRIAAQEGNVEAQHSGSVEVKPDSQQTKVANCHLWEVGKQCEYVVGWVCLNQCCAIPPISNRL